MGGVENKVRRKDFERKSRNIWKRLENIKNELLPYFVGLATNKYSYTHKSTHVDSLILAYQ